jgi:hypothetical protein
MALVEDVRPGAVATIAKAFADWVDDERCKRRLKRKLRDRRYRFGTLAQLSAASGASLDRTRQLLVAIGARPSETDLEIWTLRSPRVL